jgi:hypothetical protein
MTRSIIRLDERAQKMLIQDVATGNCEGDKPVLSIEILAQAVTHVSYRIVAVICLE